MVANDVALSSRTISLNLSSSTNIPFSMAVAWPSSEEAQQSASAAVRVNKLGRGMLSLVGLL